MNASRLEKWKGSGQMSIASDRQANAGSSDQAMVTLWVRVASLPESAARAASALHADVHGAWTEPGNLKMELYEQSSEPDTFYLYERWSSRSDLEAHFQAPYTQGAFDLAKGHLRSPIEMNYLTLLWPAEQVREKSRHEALPTFMSLIQIRNRETLEPPSLQTLRSLMELARRARGCVEFECHSFVEKPDKYAIFERWQASSDAAQFWTSDVVVQLAGGLSSSLSKPLLESRVAYVDVS
jgi:quinol monooxygenase YgiN